jgi:hypothetical protein
VKRFLICATMSVVLYSAVLSNVLSAEPPDSQQPYRPNAIPADAPLTREGWWIRINDANQAANISWRFGAQRAKLGTPVRWWKDEQPAAFDVPGKERDVDTLHVATYGLPYKQTFSFCLFFGDQGAKLIESAGEMVVAVERTDRDAACVP